MSASLAVWLSGFVFLLCCGIMEARMPAETEFCPLAKGENHCNKTTNDKNEPSFSGDSGFEFNCCSFLPAVFDKVRKIEKTQQLAQIADRIRVKTPQFFVIKKDFEIAENYRPPILATREIFIKNCVFRI